MVTVVVVVVVAVVVVVSVVAVADVVVVAVAEVTVRVVTEVVVPVPVVVIVVDVTVVVVNVVLVTVVVVRVVAVVTSVGDEQVPQSTGQTAGTRRALHVLQRTGQRFGATSHWFGKEHASGSSTPLHVVAVRSVTKFARLHPTDSVLQSSGSCRPLQYVGGSATDWHDWHRTGHWMTMATAGHAEQRNGHITLTSESFAPQSSTVYAVEHCAGSVTSLHVCQAMFTCGGIASSQSSFSAAPNFPHMEGSPFPLHSSYASVTGSAAFLVVVVVVVVVVMDVVVIVDVVTVVEVVVVFEVGVVVVHASTTA